MCSSFYLKPLKLYHFERDLFCLCFNLVFTNEEIFNIEVACQEHKCLDEFHLYYNDDEFYIIHLPSGTIVNWYKHLGRTNTCNKEGFTEYDLFILLKLLKEELFE